MKVGIINLAKKDGGGKGGIRLKGQHTRNHHRTQRARRPARRRSGSRAFGNQVPSKAPSIEQKQRSLCRGARPVTDKRTQLGRAAVVALSARSKDKKLRVSVVSFESGAIVRRCPKIFGSSKHCRMATGIHKGNTPHLLQSGSKTTVQEQVRSPQI